METNEKKVITINAAINAPVDKVWNCFTQPGHITKWNSASDDWISPRAENDLRKGGNFNYRMQAKDGSFGFDFAGVYDEVDDKKYIEYTIGDGRKVKITFTSNGNTTNVKEEFEAESINSIEMQQNGWQAILNNFKKHVEGEK